MERRRLGLPADGVGGAPSVGAAAEYGLGAERTPARDEKPLAANFAQQRFSDRMARVASRVIPDADGVSVSDKAQPPDPGETEANSNQRFARRRPVKAKAHILQPQTNVPVECTVRDISSTGVLIHLPVELHSVSRAGEYVNPRFCLVMPSERMEVDCEIAWRSGHRIGARFTSAMRFATVDDKKRGAGNARQPEKGSGLVGRLFGR
ncbi:MAG: PilZ domain-containing protein [Hyphomicrobiaceae bacterium]